MAVITLAEVKTFLQITGTDKDTLIEALIPQAEAIITNYCNKDYSADWPVGMKIPASMIIGDLMGAMAGGGASVGMKSESQGGYSYTRDGGTVGLSASTSMLLDPYKVTRAHFSTIQTQPRDRRGMTNGQLAEDKYVDNVDGVPYANQ